MTASIRPPVAGAASGRHALLLLTVGVLAALLAANDSARAQDGRRYRITDVRIDAELARNGDLTIVEDRTFVYDGTFRGASYQLPLRGVLAIRDFSLSDSTGVQYRLGDVDAEEPGTFAITSEEPFEVTWFYGEPATDEQRTFTLSYVMEGVGRRHADVAELYVKWVGEGWEVPTDRLVADVTLPEAPGPMVAGDNLHIFAHGPLDASVTEVEPGVVRTEVERLEPNTFVELRALMPPETLAAAPSTGREVRAAILEEERCLAIAADAERARSTGLEPAEDCEPHAARNLALTAGLGGVLLAAAGAWALMFQRHGREYPLPPDLPAAEFSPPSDDPPALVEWLQRWGGIGERAFTATLMDLARQGVLELRRELPAVGGLAPTEGDELLVIGRVGRAAADDDIGAGVLRLLDRIGGGRPELTDMELRDWVEAYHDRAHEWWQEWSDTVGAAGRSRGWIEPKRWMVASIALGVMLATLAGAAWVFGVRWWLALPALLAGVAMAAASPLLRRRTPEGRIVHERWNRFGEFLRQAGTAPEQSPEALRRWGDVLPYVLALGLADEVVNALDARLSPEQLRAAGGGWYPVDAIHYRDGDRDDRREGVRSGLSPGLAAITALPASTIASSPSSSGAGGGAATGGGGGAGGSGGGAF